MSCTIIVNPIALANHNDHSFPFEDPVIVINITGASLLSALENAISTYPALEGRFPQVSNITFTFDPARPAHNRITHLDVCNAPVDPSRTYKLATRGYMGRGKDGYTALLVKSEGGNAEEVVTEENGVLISAILRQYFLGAKVLGRWKGGGNASLLRYAGNGNAEGGLQGVRPLGHKHEHGSETSTPARSLSQEEWELLVMRKVMRKWLRLAGVRSQAAGDAEEGEFSAGWTRGIAPRLEGRIVVLGAEKGRP